MPSTRQRGEQAPIVRDVIQEVLEPLQRKQATQQRERAADAVGRRPARRGLAVRELVGFTSYPTLMIALGALVGGSLWGFYWVLTGIFGRMHAEEAFAALRIKNYKNFLRLKFEPDKLTIYPLGDRQDARARPLDERAARQGQPAAEQPQADRGEADRRAPDRDPDRDPLRRGDRRVSVPVIRKPTQLYGRGRRSRCARRDDG